MSISASIKAKLSSWRDYWSDQFGNLFGQNNGQDLIEPADEFRKAKRNLLWGVALGFVFVNAQMPSGKCFKIGIGGDLCLEANAVRWAAIIYLVFAWATYLHEYWRMRAPHSEARYKKADDNVGAILDSFSSTVSSAGSSLTDMVALIRTQIRTRDELSSKAQAGVSIANASSISIREIKDSMMGLAGGLSELRDALQSDDEPPFRGSDKITETQLKLEELAGALDGQIQHLGAASSKFSNQTSLLDEEKLHEAIDRCAVINEGIQQLEADVKQRAREFRQFSKSLHGRDIMASTWLDWAIPNLATAGIFFALTWAYWTKFAIWAGSIFGMWAEPFAHLWSGSGLGQ